MITIDQLLESVDLDFEPRFITKDENGWIGLWEEKPIKYESHWFNSGWRTKIGCLKLAEFENKPWQECIYEVPQKRTGNIERLPVNVNWVDSKDQTVVISNECIINMYAKIAILIDAVNELKGAKNE